MLLLVSAYGGFIAYMGCFLRDTRSKHPTSDASFLLPKEEGGREGWYQ